MLIKNYKMFESTMGSTKLPIVGKPSGEYIEITPDQFKKMNEAGLLFYDTMLKIMTFYDTEYKHIMEFINNSQGDQNIKHIINLLGEMGIFKWYKINDDYTVDILGDVKIRKKMRNLPVKFDYVTGDFDISTCDLMTLDGCPTIVDGNFICTNNNLRDLSSGPEKVGGNYDVRQSNLYSLDGAPSKINGDFLCSYNNIENLDGGPSAVFGSYITDNCLLTTLYGSPGVLNGDFICSFNLLTNLDGGPHDIDGLYDCSNNNLNTLENGPFSVGIFKCNGNRNLKDLSKVPKAKEILSDEL